MPELRPPNKAELERMILLNKDPIIFWATNIALQALEQLNPENFDIDENRFGQWEFLTRRFLWKFGTFQIVEHVYRLASESSADYWATWKPPKLNPIKQDQTMISPGWKSG